MRAWDDKGWHQYNHGFAVVSGPDFKVSYCKDCGFSSSDHVSQTDYVTQRLLHGKRKPNAEYQFGFPAWKTFNYPDDYPPGGYIFGVDK